MRRGVSGKMYIEEMEEREQEGTEDSYINWIDVLIRVPTDKTASVDVQTQMAIRVMIAAHITFCRRN